MAQGAYLEPGGLSEKIDESDFKLKWAKKKRLELKWEKRGIKINVSQCEPKKSVSAYLLKIIQNMLKIL